MGASCDTAVGGGAGQRPTRRLDAELVTKSPLNSPERSVGKGAPASAGIGKKQAKACFVGFCKRSAALFMYVADLIFIYT